MHASFIFEQQLFKFAIAGAVLCLASHVSSLSAQEPLHQRIDQTFNATVMGPVAAQVDDATFARRIYLDLAGRIPSAEETRQFLNNPSAERRTELVDQLLASDEFAQHMAITFDVMLMERRGGKHISTNEFRNWLKQSFQENKPWHTLAGQLIGADTSQGKNPAAAFLLERDVEPNLLTREVSRVFLGRDVQCAQCHDHPNVPDFRQEDYHGVFSFVSRASLFQPDKKKPAMISEAADGEADFKSVFTDRQAFTAPRLPGEGEVAEPIMNAGDEYSVRPGKTTAGIPRYSRLKKLAELLATGENEFFRRNIANRLWAMVMGRGLVHPVDMHHSDNPPSNPALMQLLTDEIAVLNFDIKAFVRELVLTEVYQRAHQLDSPAAVEAAELAAAAAALEARQAEALKMLNENDKEAEAALEQLDQFIAEAEPVRTAWSRARAAASAAATKHADAVAAKEAKQSVLKQKQNLTANVDTALEDARKAVELLGSNGDLELAVATLKKRADALHTETTKLQTEVEAAMKAVTATADALSKANAEELVEREKLSPLQESVRKHRTILVKAIRTSQQANQLANYSDRETDFIETLLERREMKDELPAVNNNIELIRKQRAAAQSMVETVQQDMEVMTQTMSEVESHQQAMQTQMDQLMAEMEQRQKVSNKLRESIKDMEGALAIIEDNSLQEIAGNLKEAAQQTASALQQTQSRMDDVSGELTSASQQADQLREKLGAARQQADAARKEAAGAALKLTTLQARIDELNAALEASDAQLTQISAAQFRLSPLEALSPEQLAWSILTASGQIDRQIASELAKLNKEKPLTEAQKTEAATVAQRQKDAETAAYASLTKTVGSFVSLFGAESGQPQDAFFATVDQALFLANGGQVRSWLAPAGDNLTGRLLKMESPAQVADELYLSTLVRKPTDEELADVTAYLTARGDKKNEAVQELAWALITSAEFRFQF